MATDRGWLVLIACCCVLILTSCPSSTGASRLPAAFKRALLEASSNKPQVIRGELIHRDHPESSLRLPEAATGSVADRYTAAAARDQARNARRLAQGVEFSTPVSPGFLLFGQLEYDMTLYLGSPPQKFVLIVDTGSDLVWVQCKPCHFPFKCYKEADPFFDPSASSSYATVPCNDTTACDPTQFSGAGCDSLGNCHIEYAYGTPGSGIAGTLSTETIAFGNTTEGAFGISNFTFGCMDNDTATFGTFDGLAGFSRKQNSLPSQLSKLTSSDVFSYCLIPFVSAVNATSPLLFGASDSNGLQLVYTPLLSFDDVVFSTFYTVNMTGISVNGTAVSIPTEPLVFNATERAGGTIFDSGTTVLSLDETIYTPVVQALKDFIMYPIVVDPTDNTSLCYNLTGVQQPDIPSVNLQFSGYNSTDIVEFPLFFENLFLPGSADETVWCLAASSQVGGPGSVNIIGNIAQANHFLETDLVNKKIGWTSRDCTLPL